MNIKWGFFLNSLNFKRANSFLLLLINWIALNSDVSSLICSANTKIIMQFSNVILLIIYRHSYLKWSILYIYKHVYNVGSKIQLNDIIFNWSTSKVNILEQLFKGMLSHINDVNFVSFLLNHFSIEYSLKYRSSYCQNTFMCSEFHSIHIESDISKFFVLIHYISVQTFQYVILPMIIFNSISQVNLP